MPDRTASGRRQLLFSLALNLIEFWVHQAVSARVRIAEELNRMPGSAGFYLKEHRLASSWSR